MVPSEAQTTAGAYRKTCDVLATKYDVVDCKGIDMVVKKISDLDIDGDLEPTVLKVTRKWQTK